MTRADYLERILAVPYNGPDDAAWATAVVAIYCDMIQSGVHFAQAAYRDAEFPWILGDTSIGHPNGEVWEPALGEALAHTLLNPVGQWGVYFAPHNKRRPAADAWLDANDITVPWIPDRPFGRASEQGLLAPFFRAIRERKVGMVGPPHYASLTTPVQGPRIEVPDDGTAWKYAHIYADMIARFDADLWLIACGSGAALTIHRAWPEVEDRATLIDIGSTLDPYCGVYRRNRVRDPGWQANVMPRNVP